MKFTVNPNVVQALLIALNFVFAILSISLIGLGIVYINDLDLIEIYVTQVTFLRLPILLIILGVLSFISSMLGCYLLRNNSRKFLIIYIILLAILLAAELTIGILAFINIKDVSNSETHAKMTKLMNMDKQTREKFYVIEHH